MLREWGYTRAKNGATNVAPIQKDKPLSSSKRTHHFQTHERIWIRPWVPTGPKTKNDCAREGQQQFTELGQVVSQSRKTAEYGSRARQSNQGWLCWREPAAIYLTDRLGRRHSVGGRSRRLSVVTCIVRHLYQATNSEDIGDWEGFMRAVVVAVYRECKLRDCYSYL
jgi:hypothetical protein